MTGHQSGHTIHRTQHHLGWNNAFPPRLVVAPGETVEFKTVDASGGQISSKSTVSDVAAPELAYFTELFRSTPSDQ